MVRTTREIADTLRCTTADQRLNHSVVNTAALQGPDRDLLAPPYTLGAWLGDGTSAAAQITTADPEIIMRIEAEGVVAHKSESATSALPIATAGAARKSGLGVAWCAAKCSFRRRARCGRAAGRAVGGPASCRRQFRLHRARAAADRRPDCGMCQKCRTAVGTLQARLRTIGVLGNKHIPANYLRASEAQRRALLGWSARHRRHRYGGRLRSVLGD